MLKVIDRIVGEIIEGDPRYVLAEALERLNEYGYGDLVQKEDYFEIVR